MHELNEVLNPVGKLIKIAFTLSYKVEVSIKVFLDLNEIELEKVVTNKKTHIIIRFLAQKLNISLRVPPRT